MQRKCHLPSHTACKVWLHLLPHQLKIFIYRCEMEVDLPDDQFLIQESTLQLAVAKDNRDMASPQQAVEQGNSSSASGSRDNVITGTETSALLGGSCK